MSTWERFCAELQRAGSVVDRPATPDHEIDRAEGYRYLTRLLRMGLDLAVEFADPLDPELVLAQSRTLGDGGNTADCVYLHALIDGRYRYRITGGRGEAPLMEIGVYSGKIGLAGTSRSMATLLEDEIAVDADGRIDVVVGGDPEAGYVFIRQYAHDWSQTTPASLSIERIDGPDSRASEPATTASVTDGLLRAARFVADAADAWATIVDGNRTAPANVLHPVPEDLDLTMPSGHRFASGHFDLAEDESITVELTPADVPYWGLAITNYWFEPLDYGGRGSHLNNRTVAYEPDGSARIVISSQRPGRCPNWIDTRGHRVGTMIFRWSRTDLPLPELATRVVSAADC